MNATGPLSISLIAALAVALAGAGLARARPRRPDGPPASVGPGSPRRAGRGRAAAGAAGEGPPRPGAMAGATVAGMVLVAAVLFGALAGLLAAAVAGGGRVALVRRARERHRRQQDAAFPDLVDLFRIAAAAGHPVHRSLEVVTARAPAPARSALAASLAQLGRGIPLASALAALGPALGPSGPVLTDALEAAARTGSALGPMLDDVAAVARDRRVRQAQAAARRLPVSMLFPLVCCVLPAFGLLAVVPLLAGSLGSLAP